MKRWTDQKDSETHFAPPNAIRAFGVDLAGAALIASDICFFYESSQKT
ncbi:MAG: hypothetical protein OXI67_21985 [Candidatus Poribacteria bacterium]|nr:hypothetical protein [Candidatus Poribacteria bacterium]